MRWFLRALVATILLLAALPASAQHQLWIRQLGTSGGEGAWAAAPDESGGVYVSGYTFGSLGGPSAGHPDAWLARYDSAGNQTWIRQFGVGSVESSFAAAPDGSGGVYVAGYTYGSLGGPSAGWTDAWLARYDGAGNQTWIRQFGTSTDDYAWAAAQDGSGGVYVSGYTAGSLGGPSAGSTDAWLARYDGAGNQTWIRQFGTSSIDQVHAAAPDRSGGVYVGGQTAGSLGGPNVGTSDAWLARYDSAGNQVWVRQLGTPGPQLCSAIAPDGSGGVYVSGDTHGSLGGPSTGLLDAWLAQYDGAGNQTGIWQFGTSGDDLAYAAAPDGSGGVYVSGQTEGSLGGPSAGLVDAWLAHYDGAGNQTWVRQFGTSGDDWAKAAAFDGSGGVFVSGQTDGSLGGPSAGSNDAWLARYYSGCTVTTYCIAKVNSLGCTPAINGIGTPSASSGGGFSVSGSNVRNNKSGLLLYGISGRSTIPFQGGTLCVKSQIKRTGSVNSGGTAAPANDCTGVYAIDMNTFALSAGPPLPLAALSVPGTIVNCQWWGRDPGFAAPNNTTLSDGLEYTVCP